MATILIAVLLASVAGLSHANCVSHTLERVGNKSVVITSSNFPEKYSNNEDQCWKFSVDSGTLDVTVQYLATETCCDHLILYDGTLQNRVKSTQYSGRLGEQGPMTYTSSDGQIYVRFRTDSSLVDQGFQACICPSGACDCETHIDKTWNYDAWNHRHRMKKLSIAAIVGIVAGIILLIGILVGTIVTDQCRRQRMMPYGIRCCRRHHLGAPGGPDKGVLMEPPSIQGSTPSWIGPVLPPAYTAISQPPAYDDVDPSTQCHIITNGCLDDVTGPLSLPMIHATVRTVTKLTADCILTEISVADNTENIPTAGAAAPSVVTSAIQTADARE